MPFGRAFRTDFNAPFNGSTPVGASSCCIASTLRPRFDSRRGKKGKREKRKGGASDARRNFKHSTLWHPFNPRSELRAASIVGERIDTRHRRYLTAEPIKMDFDRPTPSIQMTMLSGLSFRVILQIFARRSRGGTMYASINISMLPTNVRRRFVDRIAKNRPGLHFPNGTISRFRS